MDVDDVDATVDGGVATRDAGVVVVVAAERMAATGTAVATRIRLAAPRAIEPETTWRRRLYRTVLTMLSPVPLFGASDSPRTSCPCDVLLMYTSVDN